MLLDRHLRTRGIIREKGKQRILEEEGKLYLRGKIIGVSLRNK